MFDSVLVTIARAKEKKKKKKHKFQRKYDIDGSGGLGGSGNLMRKQTTYSYTLCGYSLLSYSATHLDKETLSFDFDTQTCDRHSVTLGQV